MTYTLLEIVQLILSSLDSDEVNSWNDTVESTQVGHLLKSVFYDIAVDLNLPEHETIFELEASGDNTKPVIMTIPDNVTRIDWIKYDNKETADTYQDYKTVEFKPIDKFIEFVQNRREETSNVGEVTVTLNNEDFEFIYRSDEFPNCYTTTDDKTLIFDAYKSTEDTTLQKSKTMCYGQVYPSFSLDNSFVPDLDPTQFSYYINRAKARAFAELKQTENQEAFGEARRQKIVLQKRKQRVKGETMFDRLPKYGRKR